MNNPIFLIPIIVGPLLIVIGFLWKRFPPKKMNLIYGYRTTNSLKSQAHWDFAQQQSALESVKIGVFLTALSILGFYYNPSERIAVIIALGLMISALIILIIRVERAIVKKFSEK